MNARFLFSTCRKSKSKHTEHSHPLQYSINDIFSSYLNARCCHHHPISRKCMANYTLLQRINYLVNTGKDIWDCHSSCDASKDDQHPKISKGVPPKCEAKPRSLGSCRLRVIKCRRTACSSAGKRQRLLIFKRTGHGRSMNWNCENMPCGQTWLDRRKSSGAGSGCRICGLFVSRYHFTNIEANLC